MALQYTPDCSLGIDFGTSNTVLAMADPTGRVETVTFGADETRSFIFETALCFWEEFDAGRRRVHKEGGPWALAQFLLGEGADRLIRSFKTFAADAGFSSTQIFGAAYTFETLLGAFLDTLLGHAGLDPSDRYANIIVGRPLKFAGARPDEALALRRYGAAFDTTLPAARKHYVFEPVGAAFYYAQRLEADATVLVADFGGGTSDMSVLRFRRVSGVVSADPLGHAGIGIGGDTLDFRLIDHLVSPRLGKGGEYVEFGKRLPVPSHYYTRFAHWNQLALFQYSSDFRDLKTIARMAKEGSELQDFVALIESNHAMRLYDSVSRAKKELSLETETEFRFEVDDIRINGRITRAQFEHWIGAELAKLDQTVTAALTDAGLSAQDIDAVFLTGGTSLVPAIQALFIERFGAQKIHSSDQFASIAAGLALIGQTQAPERWETAVS
jgi:hypothetical chaperone protein